MQNKTKKTSRTKSLKKTSRTKKKNNRVLSDNEYNLKIAKEYKKLVTECVDSKKYGSYELFDPVNELYMTPEEIYKIKKCAKKYRYLKDKIRYKNWFFKSSEFSNLLNMV